jgi:hypothetical protein
MEAHEGDDTIVSVRADPMQRLYLLYLNGCHERCCSLIFN